MPSAATAIAEALLIGFLIGVQREASQGEGHPGVRDFVLIALIGTAVAVVTAAGQAGVANPGPHGFSEILYGYSSTANNNGSAFAGLNANSLFYNFSTGLAMLCGRFLFKIPVLAIAGALAAKKLIPVSAGTLATHGPLFVVLLISVVAVVGALSFIPALALGPIVEHLMMIGQ